MTKKQTQEAATQLAKEINRRRFLELSRKYAIVAPPVVTLMISATDAKAHCGTPGQGGKHGVPSCAINH